MYVYFIILNPLNLKIIRNENGKMTFLETEFLSCISEWLLGFILSTNSNYMALSWYNIDNPYIYSLTPNINSLPSL